MAGDKTLHEICDTLGISRRAVQGFEQYGLVYPTGRNNRGYLLYDEEMQETIRTVKQYQSYGFRVKEIKEILTLPNGERKQRLMNQRQVLIDREKEIDAAICGITHLIQEIN